MEPISALSLAMPVSCNTTFAQVAVVEKVTSALMPVVSATPVMVHPKITPEHAATLKRDGFTIDSIREELWKRSRVHASRISKENQETYQSTGHKPDGDWYSIGRSPQDIHITVAGGPGKHSAFIPSFGGTTVAAVRIAR